MTDLEKRRFICDYSVLNKSVAVHELPLYPDTWVLPQDETLGNIDGKAIAATVVRKKDGDTWYLNPVLETRIVKSEQEMIQFISDFHKSVYAWIILGKVNGNITTPHGFLYERCRSGEDEVSRMMKLLNPDLFKNQVTR